HSITQVEAMHERLGQRPAAAFGEQRLFADQLDPPLVAIGRMAVLADPHVAARDALPAPRSVVQPLGRSEPRIDLDAESLGLLRQPAAKITEADDVIAVIRPLRRGWPA